MPGRMERILRCVSTIRKRAVSRMGSRAGESIAETLIALLISTVALMMLAGMISTGTHLITRSRQTLRTYYSENNRLEQKEDGAAGSLRISLKFKEGDIPEDSTEAVYYENTTIGRKSVMSYRADSAP